MVGRKPRVTVKALTPCVSLISSEGHEFIVKREHAFPLGTIKAMWSGPEIPLHVLPEVCLYFTYKVRYTQSSTEIPQFPTAPETALELLMAANLLDR
ncbi:Eloc [Lemmus lemmus]